MAKFASYLNSFGAHEFDPQSHDTITKRYMSSIQTCKFPPWFKNQRFKVSWKAVPPNQGS